MIQDSRQDASNVCVNVCMCVCVCVSIMLVGDSWCSRALNLAGPLEGVIYHSTWPLPGGVRCCVSVCMSHTLRDTHRNSKIFQGLLKAGNKRFCHFFVWILLKWNTMSFCAHKLGEKMLFILYQTITGKYVFKHLSAHDCEFCSHNFKLKSSA